MTPWPWPQPLDDGDAAHLVPGLEMPDLELPADDTSTVNLARLQGRHLVLCYTWTGGPGLENPPNWDEIAGAHGSTAQLEGFRNLAAAFATIEVGLIGVSTQPSEQQVAFAARVGLPFRLVSDQSLALARALRLPTFETGGVTYLKRLTLVVRDGRLEHVVYPVHPPDGHAREMVYWSSATEPKRGNARLKSA